jgi:hypothetical protein
VGCTELRQLNDLLGDYASSAVAAVVDRRDDVNADDLRDLLAVIGALGTVGPDEAGLAASLLGLTVRQVRHRIEDLADAGLLIASGGQLSIASDVLGAHILYRAYLSGETRPGVSYRDIWEAAGEQRHDAMCSALGTLTGFVVDDGGDVAVVVGDALRTLAIENPARALDSAQSIAPGLPNIAAQTVDASLERLSRRGGSGARRGYGPPAANARAVGRGPSKRPVARGLGAAGLSRPSRIWLDR